MRIHRRDLQLGRCPNTTTGGWWGIQAANPTGVRVEGIDQISMLGLYRTAELLYNVVLCTTSRSTSEPFPTSMPLTHRCASSTRNP